MNVSILIADDEKAARYGMAKALARFGEKILEAEHGTAALEIIQNERPDLVFLDLNMPELDGRGVLRALQGTEHGSEIIVVTADDSIDAAVECMRLGAADFLTKPYEVEQLRAIARRATRRRELEGRVRDLQSRLDQRTAFGALVGVSRPMRALFEQMERAARAPLDLLLRGETGTGKELIAREIHCLSRRAEGPFIAVNAAAISPALAESELFGHVRGAFTGADSNRAGVFERAHGGTLFLDEIGDMPPSLQVKVLRALQEREVTPVGSSKAVAVDLRVLSATHQDLKKAVEEGRFREDLFYRIKGVELVIPPLRQRREDIVLLADHFLDQLATHMSEPVPRLSPAAVQVLLRHPWPGNVRELEQSVRAAGSMATGDFIEPEDLPLPACAAPVSGFDLEALQGLPLVEAKNRLIEWFERTAVEAALSQTDHNVSAAARRLGMHRQSLQQKMALLGIERKHG